MGWGLYHDNEVGRTLLEAVPIALKVTVELFEKSQQFQTTKILSLKNF
jgi:hypothetical protein